MALCHQAGHTERVARSATWTQGGDEGKGIGIKMKMKMKIRIKIRIRGRMEGLGPESEVSDAFSDVGVDALITIAQAASVKDFATDALDIVRSNSVREDRFQIIDA